MNKEIDTKFHPIDELENEKHVKFKMKSFKKPVPLSKLPSPMLKLNADCFEELFEWLSVADLLTLRRTCKRLQQMVDYFI